MANIPIIADLATAKAIVDAVRSGELPKLHGRTTNESERVALGKKICELCDKEEDSPLYHAARLQNSEICAILIDDFKLDANWVAPSGKTPLCFAAYFGDSFVIEVLIKYGAADIHFKDNNGFSPLHYAVIGDQVRALDRLKKEGAEVHVPNFTESPLLLATLLGHTSCMEFLLNHNSDPNELLCDVVTPLLLGVMNNENCRFHPLDKTRDILQSLIQAGANVNKIPLLSLAYHSKELVEFLLANGADPNLANQSGRFPIEVAAMRGKREIVEMLFPKTFPIPSVQNWTVDGLVSKYTSEKFENEERLVNLKQSITGMLLQKKYLAALVLCNYAIEENPEDVNGFYAKRSFCWNHLGQVVTNELFLTNATADADLIGMSQVFHMIGKEDLFGMMSFQTYLSLLFG